MPRRRANPLAWGAVGIVVLLFVLMIRALAGGDEYSAPTLTLAGDTAKLGQEFSGLRAQLRDLDRLELFRRMSGWERRSREQVERAERLDPPERFRRSNGYLMTSLGLRAEALRRFKPAVQNALSDRDLQVSISQLVNVMTDFVLADRSYALFRSGWPERERRPPVSGWVADPGDATIDGVTTFVQELRKKEALAAVYNLTVRSVSVTPKPTGKEREADLVPFTKSLEVTIVVENTGNQVIPASPVAAVLTSETDPIPRSVEGRLESLRPKDRKSVTLRGLEPTSGAINLLRVTVGPVGGERNTLDNTVEYKFSMRKP